MKKLLILSYLVVSCLLTNAQIEKCKIPDEHEQKVLEINKYDSLINRNLLRVERINNKNFTILSDSIKNASKNGLHKMKENINNKNLKKVIIDENVKKLTYDVLELDKVPCYVGDTSYNKDEIVFFIKCINNISTAIRVYNLLYYDYKEMMNNTYSIEPLYIKDHLAILEEHCNYLSDKNYMFYSSGIGNYKSIKSVNIHIDNDVFFPPTNLDKNYTGGGMIEINTDLLKMRLIPFWNNPSVLQYQGIIFGAEAYTPNIRDVDSITVARGYDTTDRPWASFQYIGRSKYRQHYRLPIRIKSNFKIGSIGNGGAMNVQSSIHKDLTVNSVKPYGWGSQIGNGGRIALQIDHEFEMLLLEGGKFITHNINKNKNREHLNLVLRGEAHIGHQLTAFGTGLGYTFQNFNNIDGNGSIKEGKHFQATANINYRYIVHNTMLEGFGIMNTYKDDENDDEPIDVYILEYSEVNRHLLIANLQLGVLYNKTTFFWRGTLISREHTKTFTAPGENQDFYIWATLGLNFKL